MLTRRNFRKRRKSPGHARIPGKYSADQILRHEEYHDAARRNPQLNRIVREALANNLSDQELHDLVGRYITAYDGVYDFSGMTQAEIEALIEEELFADLYAGIDNTGRDALREDARRGYAQAQTEQGQNAEAQQDTMGPPEGRASYAGPKAKTANSTTLQQAEQMEKDGRSNEEIRQETGWFRGSDGQWRFEIDDSGAKYYRNGDAQFRKDHPEYARYQELTEKMIAGTITDGEFAELRELAPTWGQEAKRLQDMVNRGTARLDMLLDHPALFEAYPELRNASLRFAELDSGERGSYDARTNTITLSNELRSAAEDTLTHEIQHAIQSAEGFSGGSSVEYWMAQGYSEEEARERYRHTAGEIEARDAANRRNMTDEERKNTPPELGDENTVFAEKHQTTPYMKESNWVTEEDLDDYLRAGNRENKKKKEALAKGKKNLLTNETDIREYIRTSITNAGDNATAAYGKVDAVFADAISDITGGSVDIEGDFLEFVPFDIQHSYDEHHNPKQLGDIALSQTDYENIPTYFSTFDELLDVHTYGGSNQTTITVSKKIGTGRVVIVEVVSKSRGALQFKNMMGVSEQKYINETQLKYRQSLLNSWGSQGSTAAQRFNKALSKVSIFQSAGNSNTQNGRGSVEVPGADPRRELARLQREYRDATERADPDYDYEGQYARIKELQRQAEAAPHPSPAATPGEQGTLAGQTPRENAGPPSPQGEANRDPHSERGEIGKRKKEYKAKCLERISPSQAFIFTHPAYSRRR